MTLKWFPMTRVQLAINVHMSSLRWAGELGRTAMSKWSRHTRCVGRWRLQRKKNAPTGSRAGEADAAWSSVAKFALRQSTVSSEFGQSLVCFACFFTPQQQVALPSLKRRFVQKKSACNMNAANTSPSPLAVISLWSLCSLAVDTVQVPSHKRFPSAVFFLCG